MNRYIESFLVAMISTLLFVACVDSYMGIEQIKINSNIPEQITVKEVIPKSGALEIHFALPPGNPNIAQVVASYTNKRGEKIEFKVSRYSASILVEGLIGTDEVTVKLHCVDASGNKSDDSIVKATPLISPIEIAFKAMKVEPAFGGIKVEWKNVNANPFIIHVLVEDTIVAGTSSFEEDPYKRIYTADSVNTSTYVRQYPSIEKKFGFVVSDKWGNKTDTLVSFITPYKEEVIDYKLVKEITFFNPSIYAGSRDYNIYGFSSTTGIQNDANAHSLATAGQTIFNGIKTGNLFYGYKFVKNLSNPDPASRVIVHDCYLTFDLNMKVRLSRVLIYPRTGIAYTYKRSSPKRFRIWGTNSDNNERWTKFPGSWTLIGEYVGKEPANRDSLTPEEIEYFNNNQEYVISEGNVNPDANTTEAFRYMRLQLMETYNVNEAFYTINEFAMYGNVLEYY